MTQQIQRLYENLLVDGEWRPAEGGGVFDVRNPATGELLAQVAEATAADVDAAVQSAKSAMKTTGWGRANPTERGSVLLRLATLIREHSDELALIEAKDVGKRFEDAKGEVELSASLFEYFGGGANKVLGETYPAGPNKLGLTLREPVGVVACIVPWNYPLPLASLKVAPALAMGNAVVLKPAEEAPLSSLYLGQLALEAGLEPGLFNVVPGRGAITGDALIHHPDVAMIAFTGSTEIGRRIMHAAADRIARVELELGGKSPQIIFPDADLDAAARGAALGLFKNAGQDCCAGSRLIVHEAVREAFVEKLRDIAHNQQLGDPLLTDVTMGPVISARQLERIEGYVKGALSQGASLVTGGQRVTSGVPNDGHYFTPTLFDGVTPEMTIFQEEVFGPVGVITSFDNERQAVELANATSYGLAAAIWTRDLDVAMRTARGVEAGMVWINDYYAHVMEMPFGGYKGSGLGKDYSMHSLLAYSQLKEVSIQIGSSTTG